MILIKTYEILFEVDLLSQRSHWSHSVWQSPCTAEKSREMSGDLPRCIYLLLTLIKHSQQVLRCSWLHFLELNNTRWFILLKFQVPSWVSLIHLKAPASDWSFMQAWPFHLPHIQQHRFCQHSSKFCLWWVPLKIRDRQSLRKISNPALMSSFYLFRGCGPGAVLFKLETCQHSCGIMVSNQNSWMLFTPTVSAKGPSKRQFTLSQQQVGFSHSQHRKREAALSNETQNS